MQRWTLMHYDMKIDAFYDANPWPVNLKASVLPQRSYNDNINKKEFNPS